MFNCFKLIRQIKDLKKELKEYKEKAEQYLQGLTTAEAKDKVKTDNLIAVENRVTELLKEVDKLKRENNSQRSVIKSQEKEMEALQTKVEPVTPATKKKVAKKVQKKVAKKVGKKVSKKTGRK